MKRYNFFFPHILYSTLLKGIRQHFICWEMIWKQLNPWSWVHSVKPLGIPTYLATTQHSMEHAGSILCPEEPPTGSYPELDESSPYHQFFSMLNLPFFFYNSVATPWVENRGDGIQIWKGTASILSKVRMKGNKGWSSHLGVRFDANNPSP
jgi:hypothetical protein